MIKEIIEKWEKYKGNLENYFRTTEQREYDSYELIVKKLVELIINGDEDDDNILDCDMYDSKDIHVIDDGDYQGTQIFLVHKKTYQPSIEDYIYTHTYYGSCSGCDTLQAIHYYSENLPDEEQVKSYMMLSLHLIQKFRKMYGEEND